MLSKESSDKELLRGIASGNHAAFNILIERHYKMFYRVAYRFLGDENESEDIVQDAFLKLWECPSIWDDKHNNKFTTWLYRVVVNLCLDKNKKKKPMRLVEGYDAEDARDNQEDILIEYEKVQHIDKLIAKLPDRQRTALILCFDEGVSNQEAADIMKLSTRAVRSLLMRAKGNLKKQLL